MSAMHAMALPEDDPDRQAAVICRFHGRTAGGRAVRAQAPAGRPAPVPLTEPAPVPFSKPAPAPLSDPAPARASRPAPAPAAARRAVSSPVGSRARSTAPRRAGAGQATSSRAAHARAPHNQATAGAPLRLTRRGRAVIAAAAGLFVVMVSLIAANAAQATSHAAPPRAAEQGLSRVVVRPGQTLWSVAQSADPGVDTRQVIQQIVELNGLTNDEVLAGQRLWVPHG